MKLLCLFLKCFHFGRLRVYLCPYYECFTFYGTMYIENLTDKYKQKTLLVLHVTY